MEECWKEIEGFENYLVSNKGNIINTHYKGALYYNPKPLTPCKNRQGYLIVTLTNSERQITKRVHRLVAEAFIPNPNNLETVNHIDHNKLNNTIENLEWMSFFDNNSDGHKGVKMTDEQKKLISEKLKGRKQSDEWVKKRSKAKSKTVIQFFGNKEICRYSSPLEAAYNVGCCCNTIRECCRKGFKCYGYNFKYA